MAETNSLRYGISALDYKYKEEAVNDELLVHGKDGKMYYKRESDGQLVSYGEDEYSLYDVMLMMTPLIKKQKDLKLDYMNCDIPKDSYLIHQQLELNTEYDIMSDNVVLDITNEYLFKINSPLAFAKATLDKTYDQALGYISTVTNNLIIAIFTRSVHSNSHVFDPFINIGINSFSIISPAIVSSDDGLGSDTVQSISIPSISYANNYSSLFNDTSLDKDTFLRLNNGNESILFSKIDIIYISPEYPEIGVENDEYKINTKHVWGTNDVIEQMDALFNSASAEDITINENGDTLSEYLPTIINKSSVESAMFAKESGTDEIIDAVWTALQS